MWVKSLISYSVSITTVLHTIWGLYSSALWRHSALCTNCTAIKGKKFLITSGTGNMYWQYCGWDATKHHKIRECFSMAISSKDLLLCFAIRFRCIQSCDILHMQNIACVYNHWRLIVNISNTRFLILILILIHYVLLISYWCVVHLTRTSRLYIGDPNWVITASVDVLSVKGARPSARAMLTVLSFYGYQWSYHHYGPGDVFQNGPYISRYFESFPGLLLLTWFKVNANMDK